MTQVESNGHPTTVGVRFGGVSPVPHRPATRGLLPLTEITGPVPTAAAFPNFSWHGGPVVHCANIYASFWGSAWQTDPGHQARSGRLTQFLTDLVASNYMNVVSQYGAGSGAGSGLFFQSSFVDGVSGDITDGFIQSTVQSLIDSGAIPEPASPSNTCVMVYLADGIGVGNPGDPIVMCEPTSDTAFGYHGFFTTTGGNQCYYAVIPALDDACLRNSCGSDSGCSLHLGETQEQRQTQVTSHEFTEMITDPELNAWFDGSSGAENGDICNGQADILTVGPNSWTVQRHYSKTDDVASNGAQICLTTADNPIPPLTPGPSSATAAVAARVVKSGSLGRLLPLPSVRFDVGTSTVKYDDESLRAYASGLFAPLRHQQVVPDLSTLIRHVADALQA
ncbi:MAG TPA: hypothetical protein VGD72_03830 [Mycobacteriales bacterium]|jgi:hypothetical protein